jgi:tetratricopeptide (TPR) repeat protein
VIAFLLALCQEPAAAQGLSPEVVFANEVLFAGDHSAARADLLAAFEADPASPLAALAAHELWELDAWCAERLDARRVHALRMRVPDAEAFRVLWELEDDLVERSWFGSEPLPAPDHRDMDRVENWFVLGPLAPAEGDAPLWAPEAADGPARVWKRTHTTALGRTAEWAPLTTWRGIGSPDSDVFPVSGDVHMLAWVAADVDEATLEVETSRAFEVFWNGELAARELRGGLTHSALRTRVPVRFAKGWNALVLRLEAGEDDDVSVRVLDAQERVLAGAVRSLADLGEAPAKYPRHVAPAARAPQARGADAASGPLAALVEVAEHVIANRPDAALAVEIDVSALPHEHWRAAALRLELRALQNAFHLPNEVARRARVAVEEAVASLSVRVLEADLARVYRLNSEDRPQEAVELAAALAEQFPTAPPIAAAHHAALEELDASGVLADLERARRLERGADVDVLLHFAEDASARRDPEGELDFLRRAARLDGRQAGRVIDVLAQGDWERCAEALAWIARLRSLRGPDWYRGGERTIHTNQGRHDLVEASLREDVARGAQRLWALMALAEHLAEHGEPGEARTLFERVLELDPSHGEARRSLAALGVADPADAFFAAHAPDREAALARARAFEGEASVVLADDTRLTWYRSDGSSRSRVHQITLAVDRTGTERLHEQPLWGEPIAQRVIAPDGTVYEPIVVDDAWVMPTFDPGSLVESVYEFETAPTYGSAPRLGAFMFASFDAPYLESRLVVHVPDGLPGAFVEGQFTGERSVTPVEGGTVHTFVVRDQELLIDEPARPYDDEIVPWVDRGADEQLASLARGMRRDTAYQSDVAADVEAELLALIERVRAENDAQFLAEALHRAVAEHVLDYSSSGDTTDVWTLQRGDPTGLLAALYRLAGVDFEWCVPLPSVAPAVDPNPDDAFLDIGDFGEYGMRLAPRAGEEPQWLLTPSGLRGAPFGRVPAALLGGSVVVLGEDGPRVEALPAFEGAPAADVDIEIRLQPDESAVVRAQIVLSDLQGPLLRQALQDAQPQEREQYFEQLAGGFVTGLDLENVTADRLELLGHDLVLTLEGSIPDFVKGTRAKPNIRIPWQRIQLSGAFGRGDRRWPVALRAREVQHSKLVIVPCDEWSFTVESSRTEVVRDGLVQVLERTLRPDGALVVERRFVLDGLEVPAAEAAALAAELKAIEDLDAARVDLKPIESAGN